jgi:molybdopterin-guanine dinucleotide biosynthesis protein A
MGTDKGLLKLQTSTWAQSAVDKITGLQLPVVLSVNSDQYAAYTTIFSNQSLITDNNSLQLKGPLCGVLSVHIQYPLEDLLVLACDMPLMETGILNELMAHARQDKTGDAFVFTNDGEPEPLCSIYMSKGLAHILHLYHTGQLSKHSMKYMLEHIATRFIPLPEEQKKLFRNFNAHAELNGL